MWILVWLYLGYYQDLSNRTGFAATESSVLDTLEMCELAKKQQMDINDTRFLIEIGQGRLVCIHIPDEDWLAIKPKVK